MSLLNKLSFIVILLDSVIVDWLVRCMLLVCALVRYWYICAWTTTRAGLNIYMPSPACIILALLAIHANKQ